MRRIRLCKFNALLLLAGLCVMGSCAEDELPAPMKKARTVVKLTADWSECSSAAPAKYMVRIGNETQEVTGNVNSFYCSPQVIMTWWRIMNRKELVLTVI